LHYFEGPPLNIFNEFFIHLVELWLFIHEVGIPWIWCYFIMLEESFYIQKTLVDLCFFAHLKIWMCFLLLKSSANVFKFVVSSNVIHALKPHMLKN
jgi:hypothetical protein